MSVVPHHRHSFSPGGLPEQSFEVFPARSTMQSSAIGELARTMARLGPRFVSVTYGAGGSAKGATFGTIAQLLDEGDFPVAGHLTIAAQSRAETDAVIARYEAQGLKGIVALRGDTPGMAGGFKPHAEGYRTSSELVRAIAARQCFDAYVAAYPETHPDSVSAEACLDNLASKLDAGATAAITQFFFDNAAYFGFLEKVRARGIHQPVVPGVLLIHDFQKVRAFARKCAAHIPARLEQLFDGLEAHSREHKTIACEFAAQQIVELGAQGIDHVHLYTMNRPDLLTATCALAGIGSHHEAVSV